MSARGFMLREASISSILPAAAGAPLGALGGRAIAPLLKMQPDTGALLGGITGATLGGLLKEKVEQTRQTPPGAPYAIDPSSADIPPWAVQGAQLLQPSLKQSSHLGPIVGGDMAGLAWPVASGLHQKKPAGDIARDVAGQGLGTLGGGLAGHAIGGLIDKATGHHVNVPGINVSLSDILAGLGATIGNVKGSDLVKR